MKNGIREIVLVFVLFLLCAGVVSASGGTEKTTAQPKEEKVELSVAFMTNVPEVIQEMLDLKRQGCSLGKIARTVRVFDEMERAHAPSAPWVCRVLREALSRSCGSAGRILFRRPSTDDAVIERHVTPVGRRCGDG